jgi:hypothetical protein
MTNFHLSVQVSIRIPLPSHRPLHLTVQISLCGPTDLEEVPSEVVGPLRVGAGHLVQRTLLASHEKRAHLPATAWP